MQTSTTQRISNGRNLEVLVRQWEPAGDAWASVAIVHGLGEHSGRYERTGAALAGAGLAVSALDLTGFGASGGRRAFVPSIDPWLDDIAERLAASSDGLPRVLLGHSMGGLVTLAYALSGRPRPDALVVSAPALDSNVATWKKVLSPVLGRVAPTLSIPNAITGDQLSRDPAVGEAYFADPFVLQATTARLGAVLLATMADVRARRDALGVPTLVIHGDADTLVPPAASEVLVDVDVVERRAYPGLRHEPFNEPDGPAVVADVVEWIRAALG